MRRVITGTNIDQGMINNLSYNDKAGATKTTEVGKSLIALSGSSGKTTNASTAISLPSSGRNIAVYNNSGTLGSITFGVDSTVTSQAAGAVSGNLVGIPCAANSWTYLSSGDHQWVIASSSSLLVFLVEDVTKIV